MIEDVLAFERLRRHTAGRKRSDPCLKAGSRACPAAHEALQLQHD
jgi:hypothetical protein